MGKTRHALIALGANLPFEGEPPETTLRQAALALAEEGLVVHAFSRLFATPCFPAGAGPDYVNAAAVIDLAQTADLTSVLERLHRVEARFGRQRVQRWGMRTLDIDLLAVDDSVLPDPGIHDQWRALPAAEQIGTTPDQLILPHPRMQDRAFVLVPLAEVAPNWVHPRLGRSVRQMLADLPADDRDAVKPL